MKKTEKWHSAQSYEREWWHVRTESLDPDFYRAYAEELLGELNGILTIEEDIRILEIGSGAAGIITHLPSRFRCAIDPLEDFFSSVSRYQSFRDEEVRYFTGKAEDMPFAENEFDLIIIDNVLDHCEDSNAVFKEMKRVAKSGGIIYLRLNMYTIWGKMIRKIVALLNIDPGHPHTFTGAVLRRQIADRGFTILKIREQGFWATWKREISSGKLKELLKALSFSSPNKTLFVLENS